MLIMWKIYVDKILKNVENILYVSSKKSSRWKILPPVPPIKRMFMDYDLIKNKNKLKKVLMLKKKSNKMYHIHFMITCREEIYFLKKN